MTEPVLDKAEQRALVRLLRAGGVIACPTETQMGLLADARNPEAVARVHALKGRAASDPISVIVPSLEVALELCRDVSEAARALARAHWPGPLTLVLHARAGLPAALLKDGKLALRVPGASPALALVRAFDGPLTATSANKTGEPPCATQAELRATFGDALDAVASGSPPGAPASTIVDMTGQHPVVLRRGALAVEG